MAAIAKMGMGRFQLTRPRPVNVGEWAELGREETGGEGAIVKQT